MSDEIDKIKALHNSIWERIHSEHQQGDTVHLKGARFGQVGLGAPVVDEGGHLWRYGQNAEGEYVEFIDRPIEYVVVPEDTGATKAVDMPVFSPNEFDRDVIHRAKHNADAPYDMDTCRRYPWAAAARIRHLEDIIREFGRLLKVEVNLGS